MLQLNSQIQCTSIERSNMDWIDNNGYIDAFLGQLQSGYKLQDASFHYQWCLNAQHKFVENVITAWRVLVKLELLDTLCVKKKIGLLERETMEMTET